MRDALLTASLIVLAATASAQQLEFKGVPFGVSEERMRVSIVDMYMWECRDDTVPARRVCVFAGFTYAGVQAQPSSAYFDNDKLSVVVVNLPSTGFDDAVSALSEKYGKPKTVARSKIQNRMGAYFDQVRVDWAPAKNAHISAQRYANTIESSAVVISTTSGLLQSTPKRAKGDI